MVKSIIFDFDGVILDSVDIKSEVFKEVFKPFGSDIFNYAIDYHLRNGGISRFEKINHIFNNFFNSQEAQVLEKHTLKKFNSLIRKRVFNASFINGAQEFLENNYKFFKMFISTGTPQKEIVEILKFKKIYGYFDEVYGSPNKKDFHLQEIIKKNIEKVEEYVFLGDSSSDLSVALKYNIKFIGVESKHYSFNKVTKIKDLSSLKNILEKY